MPVRINSTGFYGGQSASWQLAGLTLSESIYPKNLKMTAHRHEPAYFGIVLGGAYDETVERKTRHCKQLTTVFHPQGESHSVAFQNREARIFRVELNQRWHNQVEDYAKIPGNSATFHGGLVASLALRLYNEYRNRDKWSPLAIEGLSFEILAEVSRAAEKCVDLCVPRWLDQVREIIAARLNETVSLQEMAEQVGVHPVHLARAWRKHFNCTIGEFIRRLRIEAACKEIACSDAPLSDIALGVGFYDQSHFSNTFKRIVGFTPAAYRAIYRSS
jgi:AraC family transcriptional regulator